jgi:tungstate transport system ATP-binding protein
MRVDVMRDSASTLPISFEEVAFRAGDIPILVGVNLSIGAGFPTVLIGPNGSGKTTLIKLATGLLSPTAGRVRSAYAAFGPAQRHRVPEARNAAAVGGGQRYVLAEDGGPAGRCQHSGARVGLEALALRPARRLSSGEQQRLALARALAREPEVLFLDEPTANLDPPATKAVEDIVVRTAAEGVKIVMATHDLGQARRLAGDIVFLARGRLMERAPASVFFAGPATQDARTFLAGDLVV